MRTITRFMQRECGTTVPEYAVMLALITAVCLGTVQALGNAMNLAFTNAGGSLNGSPPVAGGGATAPSSDSAPPPSSPPPTSAPSSFAPSSPSAGS